MFSAFSSLPRSFVPTTPRQILEVIMRDYQYVRHLGKGSYGSVCAADHRATGKRVAIKRIINIWNNLLDTKRILREIHILRQLDHRCIVPIFDLLMPTNLSDFNDLYVVFEFVDTDLEKLIKSDQFFENVHIQYMAYQLCLGLRYTHSAHVLHRDIKPANVLVNQNCSLKLCDYGLARGLAVGWRDEDDATDAMDDGESDESRAMQEAAAAAAAGQRGPLKRHELTKHVVCVLVFSWLI
jgi:mitogen-activated protein kinase 1/3